MQRFKTLFLAGLVSLIWMACDKSTEPMTVGRISLTQNYSSLSAPAASVAVLSKSAAADSLTITRARMVLKDIKFKSNVDSLNYKSGPVIVELNLTAAAQSLDVKEVPFGAYRRIEFDVHRTQPSEISGMPAADQAAYADFLAGEVYSIIIEGTVYRTGQSDTTFVYRSKVDAQQKHDLLPELVVSEQVPDANVTLLISSGSWFKDTGGLLVDPTDPNNEGIIDENLKSSIRVFKDNNKDGSKDSN